MAKDNKTNKSSKSKKFQSNIIGLLLLLAVASIGYSTTVIIMGTTGIVPVIMIVPQAILGVLILIWKFTK